MTFGNSSRLPKIDRRFTRASRPAFTFLGEAQRMKEDLLWLSAVINRQWLEERRLDTKAVKLYPQPGLIPGRVSMLPLQDILYDPRVGVNIIPQQIVEQHFSTIPLSKANIRLRWMDGTFLKSRGVLRVVPVTLQDTEMYLDFHVFDIPNNVPPLTLVGLPLASLASVDKGSGQLRLQLGKEELKISYARALNTRTEAKPESDPLEEVMSLSLEEIDQNSLQEEACDFSMVEEPIEFEEPLEFKEQGESLRPEAPRIELKQLPPGLKYAFLHGNKDRPVIISDKLAESESRKLIAVLEKYRCVLGYSLQDLKGISPNLCTHRIPMEADYRPTREPQ